MATLSIRGMDDDTARLGRGAEVADFLASPRVTVLPLGERTAEYNAKTFQALPCRGRPIPTHDLWIADTAGARVRLVHP